jgi:hypothetical protein
VQRKLEEQQERERQEVERLGRLAKEAIMAKVMAAHLNMSIEEFGAFRKVQYKRRIEAVFALLLMSTDWIFAFDLPREDQRGSEALLPTASSAPLYFYRPRGRKLEVYSRMPGGGGQPRKNTVIYSWGILNWFILADRICFTDFRCPLPHHVIKK